MIRDGEYKLYWDEERNNNRRLIATFSVKGEKLTVLDDQFHRLDYLDGSLAGQNLVRFNRMLSTGYYSLSLI